MVLMNDFRKRWQETREDTLRAFELVGESGWYITGAELKAFEEALAGFWGVPYCAGVACGQDAVEIGLRALGCRPGDRVLTTPLSAFATTLAIARTGALPVFVDTDRFGLLDLEHCEEVLEHDPEIRFMVPVHLYGNPLDLERLRRVKERFDLRVVEDCAQSIGATYGETPTGAVGQVAATSFYPTKNLGALGDGGAVLTGDEALLRSVQSLRDYGQSAKYHHDYVGYNSRLDEVHAAILHHAYLHRVPAWTERRRQVACHYLHGIANAAIDLLGAPGGSKSCFHLFPVIVGPRRKRSFMEHLERRGIAHGEHYPIVIPDQKAMAEIHHEVAMDYPVARALAAGEVSLPMHPYLTEEEIAAVIDACNAWEG
jgi:dTDP-3-amino-3,4,6-trideoxy-alpha-D-glucose transaminase